MLHQIHCHILYGVRWSEGGREGEREGGKEGERRRESGKERVGGRVGGGERVGGKEAVWIMVYMLKKKLCKVD